MEIKHSSLVDCKALVLVEMIARTVKVDLRKRLRETMAQLKEPLEAPYRELALHFLNVIFGMSKESENYWEVTIRRNLHAKFPQCELPVSLKSHTRELLNNSKIYNVDWRWAILERLTQMSGVKFSPNTLQELPNNLHHRFDAVQPFSWTDLQDIGDRVKHMNIVSHAEGYLLMRKGMSLRAVDAVNAFAFFSKAIQKFEEVLNSNTYNKLTLRTCAYCLSIVYQELQFSHGTAIAKKKADMFLKRAEEYLQRAISVDPSDPQTLKQMAQLKVTTERFDEAEEYFLKALEEDPFYNEALWKYGQLLEQLGEYAVAEQFFMLLNRQDI